MFRIFRVFFRMFRVSWVSKLLVCEAKDPDKLGMASSCATGPSNSQVSRYAFPKWLAWMPTIRG